MRVTNYEIKFLSKGHSTYIRIENPLHKQFKKPARASKQDVLELKTLQYVYLTYIFTLYVFIIIVVCTKTSVFKNLIVGLLS